MNFEEALNTLKDEHENPITEFDIEDLEGNTIAGNELYITDFYAIREWKVEKILIRTNGSVIIILNGGNFKSFHLRNVY